MSSKNWTKSRDHVIQKPEHNHDNHVIQNLNKITWTISSKIWTKCREQCHPKSEQNHENHVIQNLNKITRTMSSKIWTKSRKQYLPKSEQNHVNNVYQKSEQYHVNNVIQNLNKSHNVNQTWPFIDSRMAYIVLLNSKSWFTLNADVILSNGDSVALGIDPLLSPHILGLRSHPSTSPEITRR